MGSDYISSDHCLSFYFGRRSHEKWFISDGHHVSSPTIKPRLTLNWVLQNIKGYFWMRAGCEIWLYKFLIIAYLFTFHLMLRLHVASTSNEITLFGPHMKSDLLPTGIMLETPTIKQRLTLNYVLLILWRVISFDATSACCLNIKYSNFDRRSHENWFITDRHHIRTPTIKQRLSCN